MKIAGLFAGIGGIERGLHQAGHEAVLLCEIDAAAQKVLSARFPGVPLEHDVRAISSLPSCDVLAGGFPCQDLSQAGRTAGIGGSNSSLVGEMFRLLSGRRDKGPTWLLLENVPFMLQLDRGEAMRYLTRELRERGFTWAYRVVDTRAFGLPQRRRRVILLASRTEDPREVLFNSDVGEPTEALEVSENACGFYWTEGTRGLGWAVNAIPTLKGGSTVGIPSPPAIWFPHSDQVVTPEIRDAERFQGFPADWTAPAVADKRRRNGPRWKLVGNAVSVPVARWVGRRLNSPSRYMCQESPMSEQQRWPLAAWGGKDGVFAVDASPWPVRHKYKDLSTFLKFEPRLLSARATAGFLRRAHAGSLRFVPGFLEGVETHGRRVGAELDFEPRPEQAALKFG